MNSLFRCFLSIIITTTITTTIIITIHLIIPTNRSCSRRLASFEARRVLESARANTIAISEAVLKRQLPITDYYRAYWLEVAAETAFIAIQRGLGHFTR
ncbi:hypothetical protein BPAE_0006g00960 [Botrytis paeoniae]|uniref:Uncharacterized protein n=1 Tax=Botrytis paeoniae TaxID=278948 RepID=A0A4Z1G008_9HELO|nr:hypothetical protein BPAE_0006g00960 [Botrytis paeoniae]